MNLQDLDKLPTAMRAQALADQARATAARERVMAQVSRAQPIPANLFKTMGESWLPAKQLHAIPNLNFGAPCGAVAQPTVCDESLAAPQRETLYSGRVHVRITSYRRRLLDPDNLTAKWFLDACRYARLIRDDKPEDITYQVGQEKVARKEDERTEIVIEPLPNGRI